MDKAFALIGDSHTVLSDIPAAIIYFDDFYHTGIRGMPVWDIKLKSLLDNCRAYERVFLSPATELHGGIRKFPVISDPLLGNKFIEFQETERYCFKQKYYHTISVDNREILLKKYVERIDFLLKKYPNIILCPLAAAFMLPLLPTDLTQPSTYEILLTEYKTRCINLSTLNYQVNFRDDMNHLSVQGYRELRRLFDQWT